MIRYKEKCKELRVNGGCLNDIYGVFYYKPNYILHREDGPALLRNNGTSGWYINGKFHRTDGPACKWSDGDNEWWYEGKWVMKTKGDPTPEQLLEFKLKIL